MTDTGRYLLDAIIDDPADDLVRLAYADWLEEEGRAERAELIRVQLAMAAHDEAVASNWERGVFLATVEWVPLLDRERVLLDRDGHGIGVMNPPWPDGSTFDWGRGFICAVQCPLAAWLSYGPALCGLHPVEAVTISGGSAERSRDESVMVQLGGYSFVIGLDGTIIHRRWDASAFTPDGSHTRLFPAIEAACVNALVALTADGCVGRLLHGDVIVPAVNAAALAWAKAEARKARAQEAMATVR